MLKFRSMTNERDAVGKLLPEEERMTGFGKFMRRTSLDELPQMLNVLKGDMTLVGPRPLPTEYTSRYDERQALRLCVKPGLTGWCQVLYHGGDRKWEEKLDQDAFYVEHRSLRLDARILSMTAAALLRRFLRNQSGLSTSRAFLVGAKSDREHTP